MSEWNPHLPEVPLPKVNKRKRKKKKPAKPPQKKRGRKKQSRSFESTYFGRSFMLHAPLEYEMIMTATGGDPPDPDFIETVSYSSLNPYFKSKLFRRYLIQYREKGCSSSRKAPSPTPEMKLRALQARRKQMYGL